MQGSTLKFRSIALGEAVMEKPDPAQEVTQKKDSRLRSHAYKGPMVGESRREARRARLG